MAFGAIERVGVDVPFAAALAAAFSELRASGAGTCAIVFDVNWLPTMDLVDLASRELDASEDIHTLTLVHPSAAMTLIASAIGVRVHSVQVTAQRSLHDVPEEESTDATASKTMFVMERSEAPEKFIRRAVAEARNRIVRRFALVFDGACKPSLELADILAEELLRSTVKEIGLIHPREPLETMVAVLRLRVPTLRVAYAGGMVSSRR